MAASNAPKHDFAPAWLKIPAQESPKSSGSKQPEHPSDKSSRPRRDDSFHNHYNRFGHDYTRLHRQHSFDAYYDSSKRYPQGSSGKYRHHSVDDDYYGYNYGQYYYNNYYDKFSMQYNSQPTLLNRAAQARDAKYPSARYGQMGGYPPYYDLYPYDFYPGNEMYFGSYPSQRSASSKRTYYEKEGRSNSREGKDKDGEKAREDDKDKPSMEDFPCLNGNEESSDAKTTKPASGGGIWEHHPLSSKPGSKFDDGFDSKSSSGGNIYKALVPNKSGMARKSNRDGLRYNGGIKEGGYPTAKPPTPTGGISAAKEGTRQSPTPPLDILNTRFVTQPKILGDKKSDFLKALKGDTSPKPCENGYGDEKEEKADGKENGDENTNSSVSKEDEALQGLDGLSLEEDANQKILSSSLEAEQRLLREMGWDEQDDEEYVITEDDMKEFKKKTEMVGRQPRTNGLLSRGLTKPWSPKHAPLVYPPVGDCLNDTLSSTESESEDSG